IQHKTESDKRMKLWKRLTSYLLSFAITLSLFSGIPLPTFAADGENLALGKAVVVSGSEVDDGRWTPDLMVDGIESPESRWSSNTVADAWCYVDLGAVYDIGKVVLNWQLKAMKYDILVSYDAEHWRTAYQGVNTSSDTVQCDTAEFEPVSARYVKMQGVERTPYGAHTQGTGYSLYEFEVYADPSTAALTDRQVADQQPRRWPLRPRPIVIFAANRRQAAQPMARNPAGRYHRRGGQRRIRHPARSEHGSYADRRGYDRRGGGNPCVCRADTGGRPGAAELPALSGSAVSYIQREECAAGRRVYRRGQRCARRGHTK
ncbi:MAG: discoidin domain-containing protein, partial [Oscillospiraceae bacterium]